MGATQGKVKERILHSLPLNGCLIAAHHLQSDHFWVIIGFQSLSRSMVSALNILLAGGLCLTPLQAHEIIPSMTERSRLVMLHRRVLCLSKDGPGSCGSRFG
jgi:hypothetical protein